jgi:pimeloyl-ACP methyl ester carboxylesterase
VDERERRHYSKLSDVGAARRGGVALADPQNFDDLEAVLATSDPQQTRNGDYVAAGGLNTYYEVNGAGEPLLLLHGGFCPVETFDDLTPSLAEEYRVYLPERRGHGRTPDVDGPITFEIMAEDTIAFMDALDIRNAHLVGWSDGAVVAVHVTLQRPDLARKQVLIGAALNHDGLSPRAKEELAVLTPEILPPFLRQLYEAVSPDGAEHFDVVFEKLSATWRTAPNFEFSELERVSAPTLFMLGDADVVTVEHAAAVQRAIPNAQLSVVPGASHGLPMEKPELVSRLVVDFLANDH